MKTATGETSLSTYVDCPHCDMMQDIEPVEYGLEDGEQFGSDNLKVEIRCKDCLELFILTGIEY